MRIQRLNKQLKSDKNLLILGIIVVVILLIIGGIKIKSSIRKPSGEENKTVVLKSERDFLEWFQDFNELYSQKVAAPTYSLNENILEGVVNFIDGDKDTRVTYKDNIYYIDDMTLELDVKTRSLRYIKYDQEKILERLEINLVNGKYYVILMNKDWEYRIRFNKDEVKNNKKENVDKLVTLDETIFGVNEFEW